MLAGPRAGSTRYMIDSILSSPPRAVDCHPVFLSVAAVQDEVLHGVPIEALSTLVPGGDQDCVEWDIRSRGGCASCPGVRPAGASPRAAGTLPPGTHHPERSSSRCGARSAPAQ